MAMKHLLLFSVLLASSVAAQAADTVPPYQAQITAARQRSALGNYAGAEDAYRAALDLESQSVGAGSAIAAQTTLELALQVSNQGRFDEAATLFRQVTPAINAMPAADMKARLASYLALDAANRRDYENALKFSRQVTAERRAAVEASRTTDTGFGGVGVASADAEAELAHALRIDAEMAMRLGDYPAAEAAAQEALYIMTGQPGMPLAWRADIVLLMGQINARLGKVVVAEHDLIQATEMDRKLFGDAGPTAMAELELGKFYSDQQLYPAALASYRKGFADLHSDPALHVRLMPDQVVPFLTAATAAPDRNDADIYRVSQFVETGVEGQAIARVAARQAVTDPALQKALADVEDGERKLAGLRAALAVERATPATDRDPAQERVPDCRCRNGAHAER